MEENVLNLNDITDSINQLHIELRKKNDDLLEKVKSTDEKINWFLQKFHEQKDKIADLEKRVQKSEDIYRRKNLLLFHFPEKVNENIYTLEKEIDSIFREVLKIEVNLKDIDIVSRIGNNIGNKQPVLIRSLALRRKYEVLRAAKNLKGTNLILSEDFPTSVREVRKKLYPYWKNARTENKKANMHYNKLKVDGKLWSLEDLQKKDAESSVCNSESEAGEESVSSGLENLSDGTLRNWIKEGKLVRKVKRSKKRKADESLKQPLFRRPHNVKREPPKKRVPEK